MFWSLVIQPGKKYTSVVRDSFHLSTAVLDTKSVGKNDGGVFPVQVVVDDQELILCNLSNNCLQMNLDLLFDKGSKLTFSTSGKATIHLAGYTTDDYNDSEEEFESDNSAESSEAEEIEDLSVNQVKAAKEKKQPTSSTNSPKKRKSDVNQAVTAKKAKVVDEESSEDEENDNIDELDSSDLGDISLSDDGDEDIDDDDDEEENDSFNEDMEEDSDISKDSDSDTGINLKKKKDLPQTPKSNQKTTPGVDKKQNKTPVSKKKDDKLNRSNLQQLTNGVTPKSDKKDKKKNTPKSEVKTPKGNTLISGTPPSQKKQTVEGGVIIEELKPGNGPVAKPGKMVAVYYTGRLKSNNRVFDQSNNGPGFKFRLGRGEVIKGWDAALNGMKVGSKRRITCPPAMAYGAKGSPPSIPPNSSLVFDVELKSVN